MSIRKLKIAGREITIRSASSDEHLNEVVDTLNHRIREVQEMIPDSNEAILFVALALTDELVTAESKLHALQNTTQDKIENILQALEQLDHRPTLD